MKRWFFYPLAIMALAVLTGCKVYRKLRVERPCVEIPPAYQHVDQPGVSYQAKWWEEFESSKLNGFVEQALIHNLDLKQSWWRVAEACWQAKVVASQKFPEITTAFAVEHTRTRGNVPAAIGGFGAGDGVAALDSGQDPFTFYLLANALTYEIDLWRRIDSETRAACDAFRAAREDLEAAAWLIAGTVVDLWFTIQEQKTLLNVIDHQIEVSQTQLELIELRFSLAQSSALDVYQQRLQLSETKQQRTPVEITLETSQNLMAVLLGGPPEGEDFTAKEGLVELPPFPIVGQPAELLCNRPDLRALYRQLESADYLTAAAVADCFPRLTLAIDYDFQSLDIRELLNNQISRIAGNLAMPIFDGGRRRAEVHRRRAVVCEYVNAYGQGFLDALLEVEDSLVQERLQLKLLEQVEHSYEISVSNLEESNWHYINGSTDYLNVIAAIQSKQALERRLVIERKTLLSIRAKLYRALGGPFITKWCG